MFGEWQRSRLLATYSFPPGLRKALAEPGVGPLSAIAAENEILVCALDSYSSAADLHELSVEQRLSLPKELLPSEDGTWYLLFFSERRIERIFASRFSNGELLRTSDNRCSDIDRGFRISRSNHNGGSSELLFSFTAE